MDYRTGIRLTRAMTEGEHAFLATLDGASSFEADAFLAFTERQKLWEWFSPLARSEAARSRLPSSIISRLEQTLVSAPQRTQARIDLCERVRAAFDHVGIPSLLLKGLSISSRFYGDPDRRHQFDIDWLVPPNDCDAAVRALVEIGFDANTEKIKNRQEKLRSLAPERAPQTLTFRRRKGEHIDLHVRTKSRWFHDIDESAYWSERKTFTLAGRTFETLSDEHALVLLLASIAADLRRGACREKHFLDLYLMVRALEPGWDWDGFLGDPGRPRLRKTLVNVLSLLLMLWQCAEELPKLARAVARRSRLIELRRPRTALRLVDRQGRSVRTRVWYMRLGSRSKLDRRIWRYAVDLPHTTWRGLQNLGYRSDDLPWNSAPSATAIES